MISDYRVLTLFYPVIFYLIYALKCLRWINFICLYIRRPLLILFVIVFTNY